MAKTEKKTEYKPLTDKERFIVALAEYLVGDQAHMSIRLEMGDKSAHAWAKLRGATPLHGYPTHAEAVEQLKGWLLG